MNITAVHPAPEPYGGILNSAKGKPFVRKMRAAEVPLWRVCFGNPLLDIIALSFEEAVSYAIKYGPANA